MRVKNNTVKIAGTKPEIFFALTIANEVYIEEGVELVITELFADGGHSRTSSHYNGLAVDIRTNNIAHRSQKHRIKDEIQGRLGIDFDVLLEGENEDYEHLHIQFKPKKRI